MFYVHFFALKGCSQTNLKRWALFGLEILVLSKQAFQPRLLSTWINKKTNFLALWPKHTFLLDCVYVSRFGCDFLANKTGRRMVKVRKQWPPNQRFIMYLQDFCKHVVLQVCQWADVRFYVATDRGSLVVNVHYCYVLFIYYSRATYTNK